MPLSPAPVLPIPNFWTVYGHSYFMYAFGTRTPAGRADSIFRNLLNVDHTSWRNFAVAGSRLALRGASQGGWVRPASTLLGAPPGSTSQGAPYVSQGGAYLLAWGINDVGFGGNTAQMNSAYAGALTAVISRCRASIYRAPNYAGAAGTGTIAYGGGTTTAGTDTAAWLEQSSTGWVAYGGLSGTFTITLPTDYNGEPIGIGFLCTAGLGGGTVTYTGTAGVTGTTYTGNVIPAATLDTSYMMRRITGLTSAQAGATIIMTVSSVDSGGLVEYDGFWLEADNPPPVLVLNTARLPAAGYAIYSLTYTASGLSGTAVSSTPATITLASGSTTGLADAGTVTMPSAGGTVTITHTGITATTLTGCTTSGGSGNYSSNVITSPGPTDADVAAFNAVLPAVISQFDGMVQVVDIDSVLAGTTAWFGADGLHLNDIGAAKVADACVTALKRCLPNTAWGTAASLEQPSARTCALIRPMISGGGYPADSFGGPQAGNTYTAVAGQWYAVPFMMTNAWLRWVNWFAELMTNTAAPSVLVGFYDDRNFTGYPQQQFNSPAFATPLALSAGAGVKLSPSGGNGSVNLPMDPGLYWLVLGIATAGTCTFRTIAGPSPYVSPCTAAGASVPLASGYKLTGQSTTTLSFTFPPAAVPIANAPMIGIIVQ